MAELDCNTTDTTLLAICKVNDVSFAMERERERSLFLLLCLGPLSVFCVTPWAGLFDDVGMRSFGYRIVCFVRMHPMSCDSRHSRKQNAKPA